MADVHGVELLEFVTQHAAAGQRHLSQCTKQLVSVSQSQIAELLDYSNDDAFLEPTLFAYFSRKHPHVTLEQVLFGYLPDPSLLPSFEAFTDSQGLVYLPRLGHLATSERNAVVTIESDTLTVRVRDLTRVRSTEIELCLEDDPLLGKFFEDEDGRRIDHELKGSSHITALNTAFDVLRDISPTLSNALTAVTRRIVVFSAADFESFATVSAHGTAFFEVPPTRKATEVFFIEDMAHQCGHVLFNAATVNRELFLEIDPATPLRQFTDIADEQRDIYTAFHGVFTEAMMCVALSACLEANVFGNVCEDDKQFELLGRLSFVAKRFQLDLLSLHHAGIFTPLGESIIHQFGKIFDDIYARCKDRITQFDHSNQLYTFSLERFLDANVATRL
jgi:hypothetical protein